MTETERLYETLSKIAEAANTAVRHWHDWEALEQAQHSYQQGWEAAQAVSATFAKSLKGGGEVRDPIAADVLAKIFDPHGWICITGAVDEALKRMAEGPRLADLWNVERKFAAVFTAWVALHRRNLEHNALMMEVWKKATAAFSAVVNERSKNEQGIASSRELMALFAICWFCSGWSGGSNPSLVHRCRRTHHTLGHQLLAETREITLSFRARA
ncbi:hypothetical protein M446_7037 (plasmid) [Methylobacterium sp. 4-46]|uniref:hypothetical protein n=1 Tax=unclassified Methylobacterium TaxID=2615210 RepID=UPI000165CC3D|nr:MULTISPECIES: hypothetical protein [Methylobacterium]ACA21255.1 hypothetical protein M446_7037 [Methylobacterium sp. 4-46]WFT83763.1 hypothetical protein QA634_35405 [Methylobacterium nodulans]